MVANPIASPKHAPRGKRAKQGGFTLIELMIALTILLVGLTGLLMVQVVTIKSGTYARRSTEAAVLAEDKMEELRTLSVASIADNSDLVDAQGVADVNGLFTRKWEVLGAGSPRTLQVTVSWDEQVRGIGVRTVSTVLSAKRQWQ